jgi:hypothetical protein
MRVQDVNILSEPRGAYGFRIEGRARAAAQLGPAPAHWPALETAFSLAEEPPPASEFGRERARLPLRTGGWIDFERAPARAHLRLPSEVPDAAITHPLLGIIATVPAYWLGWESFHAGAFAVDGGVWGVIAAREAGKSSLIASLALAGVPIVCDDVLVLAGLTAFAGPRSADLREPAALALGVGEPLGQVGDRHRWRLPLGEVEPELPLQGWITLRWDDGLALRALRGAGRLRRIVEHRAFLAAAPDPAWLMELSALPVLEFARPRRWDAAAGSAAFLVDELRRRGRA